jgi:transcriptional regulator with XRE-family HTH domain
MLNENSNASNNDDRRRKELGDFLRTRRERFKAIPETAGQLTRRRTPGLRREEVAEMAGVGATWYTWLEQARDINPSGEVLEKIGKALELNPFEMQHLFGLAGKIYQVSAQSTSEEVPHSLKQFVDRVLTIPALVLGQRKDPLYWNEHFTKQIQCIYGDPTASPRNSLEATFTDKTIRQRIINWEIHAKRSIGEFRADIGDQIGSPWVTELVERLKTVSPEFAHWWKAHDVLGRNTLSFEIMHPTQGPITFERAVYSPGEAPTLRLVLFTPVPLKSDFIERL